VIKNLIKTKGRLILRAAFSFVNVGKILTREFLGLSPNININYIFFLNEAAFVIDKKNPVCDKRKRISVM
jgi:hypothetical protein